MTHSIESPAPKKTSLTNSINPSSEDSSNNLCSDDVSVRTNHIFAIRKKYLEPLYFLSSEHCHHKIAHLQDAKYFASSDRAIEAMNYRRLKDFSKNAFVLKRSLIQGCGLFTLVDLEPHQMMIEYVGEIIRNQMCNKREKRYEKDVTILFIRHIYISRTSSFEFNSNLVAYFYLTDKVQKMIRSLLQKLIFFSVLKNRIQKKH